MHAFFCHRRLNSNGRRFYYLFALPSKSKRLPQRGVLDRRNPNAARSEVCLAVEIQTRAVASRIVYMKLHVCVFLCFFYVLFFGIAARTWIELKTVWKEGIVARTWIELEIVCEEGSVAFVRRVWLKTDRRRGATHPHVE
ncbi:hypothetical protein GCK32_014500 [Trichostrongylus colubriformis]|uniref:Transmembrane protein n=1 Tax=Trichostrongylus colubriformis TaxID=6319 RepID=A0AAN8G1Y8_TRICO